MSNQDTQRGLSAVCLPYIPAWADPELYLVTIPVLYLGCEAAKPSAKQLLMSAPDLGSVLQPIWQQRPALALLAGREREGQQS